MIIPTSVSSAAAELLSTATPSPTATSLYFGILSALEDDGDDDSRLHRWSSFIGIVTAVIGNVLISFALNIQRYAHIRINREREESLKASGHTRYSGDTVYGTGGSDNANCSPKGDTSGDAEASHNEVEDDDEEAMETDPLTPSVTSHQSSDSHSTLRGHPEKSLSDIPEKSYLRSPYWWAGIILMTIGEAGNFLAYGFAPASIVSPLGVVALISNCIIAPFMLKEKFRKRDALGVLIAIAGAVTVVLSAKHSEEKLGPGDIWGMITTWEFELYLGITVLCILVLMCASSRYGSKSILIDLGLVGLFGGYTALSTKGVSSLLSYTFWRVVTFPVSYLLVAVLISSALMQIKYINRALQRFDSTVVIPTQFVLFTLSVIIGSAVLYRDFEKTSAERAVKFVGGCLMTFLGVYCITSGRARDDLNRVEPVEGPEEEAIHLIDEEARYRDEPRLETDDDGTIRWRAPEGSEGPQSDKHAADNLLEAAFHQSSPHEVMLPSAPPSVLQRKQSETPSISITPAETPSLAGSSPVSLTDNPWLDESASSTPRRPGLPTLTSTTSHPVLPSLMQSSRQSRPVTPRNTSDLALPTTTPDPSTVTDPPSVTGRESHLTLSRRSITQFLPGPLVAPLSGSLSAVVADELLRGAEGSPSSQRSPSRRGSHGHAHRQRHQGSEGAHTRGKLATLGFRGLRKVKSQKMTGGTTATAADNDDRHTNSSNNDGRSHSFGDNALIDEDANEDGGGSSSRRRSFGATITEMFRGRPGDDRRRPGKDRERPTDEESGPTG